jgi:hypothetical protein
MEPILIGITGKARSGKDTVAEILSRNFQVKRYAFAGPLKIGLATMLGLDGRHVSGDLKEIPIPEFGGKSPRQMLQTLGTEWGRQLVSDSLWVDLGMSEWEKCLGRGRSLVITDVRFENEAEAIRKAGGVVAHVQRGLAPGVAPHSSEAGVEINPFADWIIPNNDSLGWLESHVISMFENVQRRMAN